MKIVYFIVLFIISLCSSSLFAQGPESEFSFTINELTVDFTDLSTNSPTIWLWDYGDGNTSTMQNPTHTYTAYGNYTTCLTVANNFGTDSTCQIVRLIQPLPTFRISFDPPSIAEGQSTTLTFTIDNSTSLVATGNLDFTNNLPANLEVSTIPNAMSTCLSGVISATSGSTSISFTGGSVAANSVCEVTVDVSATTAGTFANTTSDLTSTAGNSGSASATLQVSIAVPTLGQWGLTILFLLICIFSFQYFGNKKIAQSPIS